MIKLWVLINGSTTGVLFALPKHLVVAVSPIPTAKRHRSVTLMVPSARLRSLLGSTRCGEQGEARGDVFTFDRAVPRPVCATSLQWSPYSVEKSLTFRPLLRARVLPHTFLGSRTPSWIGFQGRTGSRGGDKRRLALCFSLPSLGFSRRRAQYDDSLLDWCNGHIIWRDGIVHEGFIFAVRRQQPALEPCRS